MRVLLVAEKQGTAIDKLCALTVKAAPWHIYKTVYVHPKRPTPDQLNAFEDAMQWCDVIDFRYWRTAELLHATYDIKKPSILTHYNPYDLTRKGWAEYKINVVVNTEQQSILKSVSTVLPLPIDTDFWHFDPNLKKEYDIIMVANRIEGKKGIREVARAAHDLKLKMLVVGQISDSNYWEQVSAANPDLVFRGNISDEDLRMFYWKSNIHVCNSIDKFESGTMPILEAMSCGTPVLTRNVGHVPDLNNGRNLVVRKGAPDDMDDLKKKITDLLADSEWRKQLSVDALHSLRYRTLELYGYKISRLYHQVKSAGELVSVVLPIIGRPNDWMDALAHLLALPAEDLEILVCDDGVHGYMNQEFIDDIREKTSFTIKYFNTVLWEVYKVEYPDGVDEDLKEKTYGLARARNKGILESEGKWIMFVDENILIEPDSLSKFYENRESNLWLWGIKDDIKKGFVENFSFIDRATIIRIGMFNEQITQYGGMSQEIRRRAELNKIQFKMIEKARGRRAKKSSNKWRKQSDIAKSKSQCYKLYG